MKTVEQILKTPLYKDCYKRVKEFPEFGCKLVFYLKLGVEGYVNEN